MILVLNKYENMCTKDMWIAKSHKEQQIVAISSELENMNDTSIKL